MKRSSRGILVISLLFGLTLGIHCRQENSDTTLETPSPDFPLNGPLPIFLKYVTPGPDTSLSLDSYQQGEHFRSTDHGPPSDAKSKICAEIDPEPLLEPGDFYGDRDRMFAFLPERLTVAVDQQELQWNREEIVIILSMIRVRNDDGEVIAQTGGPQITCWLAPLELGRHVVLLTTKLTSGEASNYAWSFTLIGETVDN